MLRQIGNTPLVELERINPSPNVRLLAKLERNNPGGSVKDRVALSMIESAEASGALTLDKTIIEATSGNTGIGLAIVAAVKGYRIVLVMQEGASEERKRTLTALGARLILTPATEGGDGAIEHAYAAAAAEPERYFIPDQYNNPANPLAHYYGTGPEIWSQTEGQVTHFVAAMGTTGTLMGNGRRLRELNPAVEIVAVEPYLGHRIQGMKNLTEAYVPGIYDPTTITRTVKIDDDMAFETSRRLATTEGLFVGMSAGAAVAGALEVVARLQTGVVVVLLPDAGDRYLSTPLFQVPASTEDLTTAPRPCFVNTLSRRLEPFEPLEPFKARMYACGPTVHALPHIGLMRRIVVADLVRRTLRFAGYDVELVMNITDIDDKTLAAAEEAGEPLATLTERHITEFNEDLATLHVEPATAYPRASEHIDDMLGRTRELIERGVAYEKHRSVYFDVSRFVGYGRLAGVDLSKLQVGATVDLERYDKDNPRDFTLFKRSSLAEIRRGNSFQTEWGHVRPAWHIECAAIAMSHLGQRYDIHLGGHDLIFPHHENEIAVCQTLTGEQPASYWLHSAVVTGTDGKKMSHSAGNAVSVRDLVGRGYTGREIRYYLLTGSYRQPLRFSFEALDHAASSLRRVDALIVRLRSVDGDGIHPEAEVARARLEADFIAAIYEDLNMPAAIAHLSEFVRRVNRLLDLGLVGRDDARAALALFERLDKVFGVGSPAPRNHMTTTQAVSVLVHERQVARENGDHARADELREELAALGVTVEDTAAGARVRPTPGTPSG